MGPCCGSRNPTLPVACAGSTACQCRGHASSQEPYRSPAVDAQLQSRKLFHLGYIRRSYKRFRDRMLKRGSAQERQGATRGNTRSLQLRRQLHPGVPQARKQRCFESKAARRRRALPPSVGLDILASHQVPEAQLGARCGSSGKQGRAGRGGCEGSKLGIPRARLTAGPQVRWPPPSTPLPRPPRRHRARRAPASCVRA